MSISKDNYLVGLDWDPQQVLNSTSEVPSAQFSVPNNLEAMDNSSMGHRDEAHLGGYNGSAGRHSRILPGCGLAQKWNIKEVETTSSYHLEHDEKDSFSKVDLTGDVKKAVDACGTTGSKYFPIMLADGSMAFGAERFALLEAPQSEIVGTFNEKTCILKKQVGKGVVFYCGTNIGEGSKFKPAGFEKLMIQVCLAAGIKQVIRYETDTLSEILHRDKKEFG